VGGVVIAALDRAIAAAAEVRTNTLGQLPTNAAIETWPVTAVQIPWAEWTALVAAVRDEAAA
jgi:hypothetical protein